MNITQRYWVTINRQVVDNQWQWAWDSEYDEGSFVIHKSGTKKTRLGALWAAGWALFSMVSENR